MLVVMDTNILVSALWSKNGAPARAVGLVLSAHLVPCYDHRIMMCTPPHLTSSAAGYIIAQWKNIPPKALPSIKSPPLPLQGRGEDENFKPAAVRPGR